MKKSFVFLFLLLSIFLHVRGCFPFCSAKVRRVAAEATYSAGTQEDVVHFVENYMIGSGMYLTDTAFDCSESREHTTSCACRGRRQVTAYGLIEQYILRNPRIVLSEEHIHSGRFDIPQENAEVGDVIYDMSKTYQHVIFTMDQMHRRYRSKAFDAFRSITFQEHLLMRSYKKEIDNERKRCIEKGVISVLCARQCRIHRKCYVSALDATRHQDERRCPNLLCGDHIGNQAAEESTYNFVKQELQDVRQKPKCIICNKRLWKFK